ncbi:hypothetical protein ACO0QE_003894 [Hanseniaspora vineae]
MDKKLDFIRECIEHNNKNDATRDKLKSHKWLNHTNKSSLERKNNSSSSSKRGRKPSNFTKRIVSKSARQVLSDEWKRINNLNNLDGQVNGQVNGTANEENKEKSSDAAAQKQRNEVTYFNVEAPPSLLPVKRYCDITGLKGVYRAPSNNLYYHNAEVYTNVIKPMLPGNDQQYLKLRKADVVLK